MNVLLKALTKIYVKARLASAYVKAVISLWVSGRASIYECVTGDFKRSLRAATWRVYRVLVFREPPLGDDEPYELDFIEIHPDSVDRERVMDSIEPHVPFDWDHWKVEIRCSRGLQKRRLVVRRGESISLMRELRTPKQYRILTAVVSFGNGCSLDVMDRMNKYVVVQHRTLYPRDIFPLDDQYDMPGSLMLRTVTGTRLCVNEYKFSKDVDMRHVFSS